MADMNSDMDEIWAILAQEGRENLSIVEDTLLNLEKKPDNPNDIAALFRALHTFKGTVRMMDFSNTESVAHHAEDLVAMVRDDGVRLDGEMIDLLLVAMDRMRYLLEHILSNHTDVEPGEVSAISGKLEDMVKRKRIEIDTFGNPSSEEPLSPAAPIEVKTESEAVNPAENLEPVMKLDLPDENIDLMPEEEAFEPLQDAIIFDPVDLAKNPEYVQIFLDVTLPELDALKVAIAEIIKNGPGEYRSDLFMRLNGPLETLQIASERMGYERICSILEAITQKIDPQQAVFGEKEIKQLIELEGQLSGEFEKMKPNSGPALKAEIDDIKLESAYHQWYAQRLKSDLDQLDTIIDKFSLDGQYNTIQDTDHQKELSEELNRVLGSVYHICIDDHIDRAAQLTLTLEDLSFRISQGEIPVTPSFITLLQTYTTQLREIFETNDVDNAVMSMTFDAMIGISQQLIKLTSRNPILQLTRNFINHLDIDPEFKKIITNENLAEISQSIRAGFNLYILRADVEEDEEIGMKFYKWVSSGSIIPITNINIRTGQHCLVSFLIAASYDINTIRNILSQMDPTEKYFSISKCAIQTDIPLENKKENWYVEEDAKKAVKESAAVTVESLSNEVISELTEMVGELVADHSTLNRIISRMAEKNTTEGIMRLLRSALSGNNLGNDIWEKLRSDLQSYWAPWEMDISSLAQTDVKLNAGLTQIQEKTRSLGLRPAEDLLNPLPQIAQSFAFRQGKQVNVKYQGGDSELDQRTLGMLADTVHNLIGFCISESIEPPDLRAKSGKDTTGMIRVSVFRTENHTQVVIDDDGSGLNQEKLLSRGSDLGWAAPDDTESGLISWLFNPDFYPPGGSEINLAVLNQVLTSNKGKMTLVNKTGQGLHFTLSLQLDMAVVDGMVVRIGEIRYIVPVYAIQRIIQPTAENIIDTAADGGGKLLNLEGKVYPVRSFRQPSEQKLAVSSHQQPQLLVIIEKDPQSIALDVDELIGRQSVLVRPLSGDLMNNRNTIGCALLGEGEIGMVLDLDVL